MIIGVCGSNGPWNVRVFQRCTTELVFVVVLTCRISVCVGNEVQN